MESFCGSILSSVKADFPKSRTNLFGHIGYSKDKWFVHTFVISHVLICPKAFEVKPLDLAIDFSDLPKNRVVMIIGEGQTLYWKGSNVTVYEFDEEGKEQTRRLIGIPDGQGVTPLGVKLYVTKGKVKEVKE